MGDLAKLLLKIVINNQVWPVLMVGNNCKKIEGSLSALKNWYWSMGGLAKLLLKIVINNRVQPASVVVNNSKKSKITLALWKIDFGVWEDGEIIA